MEGVKKDIDTTNSNNLNNNVGDQVKYKINLIQSFKKDKKYALS